MGRVGSKKAVDIIILCFVSILGWKNRYILPPCLQHTLVSYLVGLFFFTCGMHACIMTLVPIIFSVCLFLSVSPRLPVFWFVP